MIRYKSPKQEEKKGERDKEESHGVIIINYNQMFLCISFLGKKKSAAEFAIHLMWEKEARICQAKPTTSSTTSYSPQRLTKRLDAHQVAQREPEDITIGL